MLPSERFWAKAERIAGADCWLWNAACYQNGYGMFATSGSKARLAHRVAYELTYGPIPEGLLVCHKCDVRCCVRPEHLFLGTNSDNQRDAVSKGRLWMCKVTHCTKGHEYTAENTRMNRNKRYCKRCELENRPRYWEANKIRAREKRHRLRKQKLREEGY